MHEEERWRRDDTRQRPRRVDAPVEAALLMFYRRRTPPKPKEVAMPIEKKFCAYCGKNRFGLVRHFVGFHHLCTRLCKERFLERRARVLADYRERAAARRLICRASDR